MAERSEEEGGGVWSTPIIKQIPDHNAAGSDAPFNGVPADLNDRLTFSDGAQLLSSLEVT